MASGVNDKVNNMFSSIGAVQTLVDIFPINLRAFKGVEFYSSFDVLLILFKLLGIDREELIKKITEALCGKIDNNNKTNGFIGKVEKIIKTTLELNLTNALNCTTNPIISNNVLDYYTDKHGVEGSGEGIVLNVADIDFTGVLYKNPLDKEGKNFYFDVDGEKSNINKLYTSEDFNAFLWYIINKSDKSQKVERVWDNRNTIENQGIKKDIITCTYIDDAFPNSDKIKVQICGARDKEPANYFKTRKLSKNEDTEWRLNKTIFEFNHDFIQSIKFYDAKVIVAEIIDYLLGNNNFTLGFSLNEEIIQGKLQQIITKVISSEDLEINDCFYSFSNEEYNLMLEKAEKHRYNVINNGEDYIERNTNDLYNNLSGITSTSSLEVNKTIIEKTLKDLTVVPAQIGSENVSLDINCDLQFELMRALVYPFVRPLFTPKVMFLLLLNKQIMGGIDDAVKFGNDKVGDLILSSLFNIITSIIGSLKDLLVELFFEMVMAKLKPLLELFASRLLLETLQMYKDLLNEILNACGFKYRGSSQYGINDINNNGNVIDNVNYADIIPTQTLPNETLC